MIGELIIGWAVQEIFIPKTKNSPKSASSNSDNSKKRSTNAHALEIENAHLKKHLKAKDEMLDDLIEMMR